MPETWPQWLWFTFFTVGSLGGWLMAALVIALIVKEVRFRVFMWRVRR